MSNKTKKKINKNSKRITLQNRATPFSEREKERFFYIYFQIKQEEDRDLFVFDLFIRNNEKWKCLILGDLNKGLSFRERD